MAKNLFFGYEMNFGFSKSDNKEIEVKQTGTGSSPITMNDIKSSNFSFGPNLMNGVRIGYVF
ncbi:hypothetical protein [Pontibacter sp. SGAir0037]|uniref:hypothetical protein n=1 Tax=Pontibacter sp. SGAir0037 TaxID=2571030 RepID=UPI0010F4F77A|nr:hypothetical protein [Pontibacter sp. SGAir0037]